MHHSHELEGLANVKVVVNLLDAWVCYEFIDDYPLHVLIHVRKRVRLSRLLLRLFG
jgi:hypothetical protein